MTCAAALKRRNKSFSSEIASGLREVKRANAEFANQVRELEYPAIRERIRSPPIPLYVVLLGLLNTLLFISVRLPLHVLKRFGLANASAVVSILRDLRAEFRGELQGDLRSVLSSISDLAAWLWHWAEILASCIRIEAQILWHHALMGACSPSSKSP